LCIWSDIVVSCGAFVARLVLLRLLRVVNIIWFLIIQKKNWRWEKLKKEIVNVMCTHIYCTVGITPCNLDYLLCVLIYTGREIVVRMLWQLWGMICSTLLCSTLCRLLCRLILLEIEMGCLTLDYRNHFCLFFYFVYVFCLFWGYWPSPPSVQFLSFLLILLRIGRR